MLNNTNRTFSATPKSIEQRWYLIDATGLVLGRMAAIIANYLRGKGKVYFTPNLDCGDHVVVINTKNVVLTGGKELKRFYWHTGHIGGIKYKTMKNMRLETPERIVENAVCRMITRNPLGRSVMRKLHVYGGDSHPHEGQRPETLDLRTMNRKNFRESR
ncbi:MAG: 50S ribosomal protein L13 [Rickettsiales bacterium]|jgi:large subunit ribosomal protein L13|nr:50S ribosomal protein L13 [Rickettsiales bacterium]